MIRWLGKNFRTFLWALLMAIAVWVAAVTTADPDEVRQIPNPLPLEIVGQDPSLVIVGEMPKQIDLTLRAPRSVWTRLLDEQNEMRAIMDISGLNEGQHTLEIQVQIPVHPIRIISVTPKSVSFTLEPLATKTIPLGLQITGEPAIGYQAGDPRLVPEEITISGPQSQVMRVAGVQISIDLSNARENLDETIQVQALDADNQTVTGLGLNPPEVKVSIPISQQGGYRDLAVKVVVRGQIADGYRLANISVFPPVVTVFSGDPGLVNSLPGVLETQPLDLNNVNDDIKERLAIDLPEGVSLVGDQTVLVQVSISPIQSSLTLSNKTIEIEGLAAGWSVSISPEIVDVILSGPLPLLETLSSQDVRVIVDVSDLTEGPHQLTPQVSILVSDIAVESILPGSVEITLDNPGAQTSTPTPGP